MHRQDGLCPKAPSVACSVALVVFLALTGSAVGDVSKARAAVAQFRAEIEAFAQAQTQSDMAAMQQHQLKAEKHLKEACQFFDKAGASRSEDPELLREYADVLLRLGDADLAAEAYQRATAYAPDHAVLWFELGRALSELGHGRAAEAARAFRRSLALDAASPAAANTHTSLGFVYEKEGLYDLARESFADALAVAPDHIGARIGAATLKIRDGEIREGCGDIDGIGAIPPEYAAQFPRLLAEALQDFDKARRCFPDTAEDHMAYAKLLFRAGRLPESLVAAERSAALDPDEFTTWNFIGGVSRQLGNTDRAREAYSRSLELKPDQPRTLEALKSLEEQPDDDQP